MQNDSIMGGATIERVQEGMRVVDATGEDIGKVEYVQMGDPAAVTAQGNQRTVTGLAAGVLEGDLPDAAEPDVPNPLRASLRRTGFVKIDGKGLLDKDRYVSSERVREVSGDVVHLDVRKSELAAE